MCAAATPPARNFKRETGFAEKDLMPKAEVTAEPET